MLQRGDGEAVEQALSGADADSRWVRVARARAALLTGDSEALKAASAGLSDMNDGADAELAALKIRVDLKAGSSPRTALVAARSAL